MQSNETAVVCRHVIRYARSESASRIIVGLPLHKNGTVAEQTNVTLRFAQELAIEVLAELGPTIPVAVWDERYTSKEAAARAHSRDPDRYLYGTLDADAACIILEHYYHDNGVGSLPVSVMDPETRMQCLNRFEHLQRLEELEKNQQLQDREMKLERRRNAIARARELEKPTSSESSSDAPSKSSKRNKKRKKKR